MPGVNLKSECFTVSKAKTYLGRLMDKASKGEAVYIMRGKHLFVLQKVQPIDPIPMRPLGYFANCYSQAETHEENRLAKASVVQAPQDLE